MAEFAHLHVHTQYSLLDGALRVKDLARRARSLGVRAVAITDHANMFGAIQHWEACLAAEVQPLLGCEVNVARPSARGEAAADHLVLLAASAEGYRNLVRIVSRGHIDRAADAVPSVSWETVAESARGLVALSGCLGGVLAQQVLEHGPDAGLALLGRMRDAFDPGALWVELQDHGLPEQRVLGEILVGLARKTGVPVVATNDVHFAAAEDREARLLLGCIESGRDFATARAEDRGGAEMYLKSPAEMADRFRHLPEAVRATMDVAERCSGLRLDLRKPMVPDFPVPAGTTVDDEFRRVAREGLGRRLREAAEAGRARDEGAYRRRLEDEIDVVVRMRFAGYFLVVWDFIRFAKERGVPVGPGRGSGAGSLVAWAMRITDIDPVPYGLLFERFLNPERVSMPDFDIDFCMNRRDEVLRYVSERYGRESVGQIATFHELRARSVIKDVGRAMGMTPPERDAIANLVPPKGQGQMCTIDEALQVEPRLVERVRQEPRVAELVDHARKLEGLARHAGMHAAGVVISRGPLWDHVPCFVNEGAIVTQYDKDDVEAAGLVKFDFLGLKTLTVIDIACRLVAARPDRADAPPLDPAALPLDDAGTYDLLKSGDTTGVFQLESEGMQRLFKSYAPETFEDIIALGALYRPGPLGSGMVQDFVDCRHGRKAVQSLHPLVDDIVRPTRGVIVYQEQVMQIAQKLAGYTLGGADLLRRAMGKKKPEEMAKQRVTFVEGAKARGVREKDAERIFELLEHFSGYGFNKSHSAAYGLLTYQTAYLKAHYPVEFLCALMSADRDRIEKVVRVIAEGRAWGVTILPPDVNESDTDFAVVYAAPAGDGKAPRGARVRDPLRPQIRFGLGALRGVGESALEAIFEARRAGGPFHDLFDFAGRVDARRVNKVVLDALVQSGAFDATLLPRGIARSRAFCAVDRALERARAASRDRERGQTTLFGSLAADAAGAGWAAASGPTDADYPPAAPWDLRETLSREKQALGFYVSGHPMDRYGRELGRFDVVPAGQIGAQAPWSKVRVAGVVEGYRERVFRGGGGKVAWLDVEDATGRVQVKVRQDKIDAVAKVLAAGEPVLVAGKVSFPQAPEGSEGEGDPEGAREPIVLLDEAVPLADAIRAETRVVVVRLDAARSPADAIPRLADVLRRSPGPCPVGLVIGFPDGAEAVIGLGAAWRVDPGESLRAGIERALGPRAVEFHTRA